MKPPLDVTFYARRCLELVERLQPQGMQTYTKIATLVDEETELDLAELCNHLRHVLPHVIEKESRV